jgi:hypothetical protein
MSYSWYFYFCLFIHERGCAHTGWPFDAATYNVQPLGPENSYRHARGEKVKQPNGNYV